MDGAAKKELIYTSGVGKSNNYYEDIYIYIYIYIYSGAQVPVLLFGDCAFAWCGLRGVLIIMGYFSTR